MRFALSIAEPATLTEALLRDDLELAEEISEAEVIEALLREDPAAAGEAGQDGANKQQTFSPSPPHMRTRLTLLRRGYLPPPDSWWWPLQPIRMARAIATRLRVGLNCTATE